MQQLTIEDAMVQQQAGVLRAAIGAEMHSRGWLDLAYAFFKQYCTRNEEFWPDELTKAFNEDPRLVAPKDDRAWGYVYQRAAREGLIERGAKLKAHPQRHGTKVLSWKSLVYVKAKK